VGAIFLDQGFDTSRKFILQCLDQEIRDVLHFGIPTDPKVELQELIQDLYGESPIYRIVDQEQTHGADFTIEVHVAGRMLGTGKGQRMVDAEREAASLALIAIRKT
jgi:dsRNA-specific ribonuclease